MPSSVRSQTNLKTVTLEYSVDGPFDGVTVAPSISLDPTSPNYVEPDPVDRVYKVALPAGQALGLIDLSLVAPHESGGIGDRYVRWVNAGDTTQSTSFVNGVLGVYDNLFPRLGLADEPLLLQQVRLVDGFPGFYERACIFVPQGAYLGISGLAAPLQGVNRIRLNVQAPRTDWEGALLEESCCCDSGPIPLTCPVILSIAPTTIPEPVIPPFTMLTITGTGFRSGLAIEANRNPPDSPAVATLEAFTVVTENIATVVVASPTPPGVYTLTIFDPAQRETCSSSGNFTVSGMGPG